MRCVWLTLHLFYAPSETATTSTPIRRLDAAVTAAAVSGVVHYVFFALSLLDVNVNSVLLVRNDNNYLASPLSCILLLFLHSHYHLKLQNSLGLGLGLGHLRDRVLNPFQSESCLRADQKDQKDQKGVMSDDFYSLWQKKPYVTDFV